MTLCRALAGACSFWQGESREQVQPWVASLPADTFARCPHLADAHKPYAWVSYLGLFAVHWVTYLLVMGAARWAGHGPTQVDAASG